MGFLREKFGGFSDEYDGLVKSLTSGCLILILGGFIAAWSIPRLSGSWFKNGEKFALPPDSIAELQNPVTSIDDKVEPDKVKIPKPPERFDLVYLPCVRGTHEWPINGIPEDFEVTPAYLEEKYPEASKIEVVSETKNGTPGFKNITVKAYYDEFVPVPGHNSWDYQRQLQLYNDLFDAITEISDDITEEAQSLQISEDNGSFSLVLGMGATDDHFLQKTLGLHIEKLRGRYIVEVQKTDLRGRRMYTKAAGRRKEWNDPDDGLIRCLNRCTGRYTTIPEFDEDGNRNKCPRQKERSAYDCRKLGLE